MDVAYVDCHALVLGRFVAASTRGNFSSPLERLPEHPTAFALVEELKTVTTKGQFEKREYRIYFRVESKKSSFILAYINTLTYFNEVKYKVRILNTI